MSTNGARDARETGGLSQRWDHMETGLGLTVPPALLERVAALVADLVVERLGAESQPWLDPKAAALHLDCPVSTVYAMAEDGRLPAHRLGRSLRFRRAELDAALEARS